LLPGLSPPEWHFAPLDEPCGASGRDRAPRDQALLIVSSPELKKTAAVRYAWEAHPVCSLYNGAGLPATRFRTDAWPTN
jgi:hypothetical protein